MFSDLADDFVAQGLATRGTMMGRPCLRANGELFASGEGATQALVVKLPAARVQEEIAAGRAVAFAPGGRAFREWIEVTDPSEAHARELMFEALAFVAGDG
ncbi:MAG: hypothetical protein AAF845_11475 [Bacteroidota bacterium]